MVAKPQTRRRRKRNRKGRIQQWEKEARWLIDFMQNLHETPAAHGIKWKYKMLTHYAEKYDALYKDTPPQCQHEADVIREGIKAIMSEYDIESVSA